MECQDCSSDEAMDGVNPFAAPSQASPKRRRTAGGQPLPPPDYAGLEDGTTSEEVEEGHRPFAGPSSPGRTEETFFSVHAREIVMAEEDNDLADDEGDEGEEWHGVHPAPGPLDADKISGKSRRRNKPRKKPYVPPTPTVTDSFPFNVLRLLTPTIGRIGMRVPTTKISTRISSGTKLPLRLPANRWHASVAGPPMLSV
jgi:hypothetical protein